MLWFGYNILFVIGFLLLLPRFLWRMQRRGGYRRDFFQRLGFYQPAVASRLAEGGWIWVHAVSVGEILVALRLVDALRARRPQARFLISTTTSTAHAMGRDRMAPQDQLVYFPLDLPWVTRRVLDLVKPRALILIEAEFWPNLIRAAARRGLPKILVNGRVSESSQRGYRRLKVFTRRIFPLFDALCVQSEADRDRLLELGAPPETLHVMNSAKYEVAGRDAAAEARARDVLERAGFGAGCTLLLGGSTWPGEEQALIEVYQALRKDYPHLRLVLAPRHVERILEVLDLLHAAGLSFCRRSLVGSSRKGEAEVFVLDTTGELSRFYPHADVIFVGKSLASHGGQNVIEPAVCAKAIVVGPHMENFPVVSEDFRLARAMVQVNDTAGLLDAVRALLADPTERTAMGERAERLVREKSGAIGATVKLLEGLLGE